MPELSFTLPSKRNFCNANENMINMIAACMFKFYLYLSMFHICLKCDSLSVCPVYRYFLALPSLFNVLDCKSSIPQPFWHICPYIRGKEESFPHIPNATSSTRYFYVCCYAKKHICKGPSQKLETISDCLLKSRGIQHLFLRRRTRRSQI